MSFGPATIIRPGATATVGVVGPAGRAGADGKQGSVGPAPWAPPVPWQAGLVCVVGPPATYITINGASFVCLAPHSAGVFSQDFAAGYWAQVSAPGANGAVWFVAAVVPSPFVGNVGDLFLNKSTGDVYQKTANGWGTPVTNLTGPPGGAGTNGNTIQNGSGAPGAGVGINGDFYLDTANTRLYGPKASGSWPNGFASLIGPAGPANVLSIGTVATGAAGSSASATISGASPNQALNLTIPQGAGGAGATFSSVTVNTLAYGSQATASLGGSAPNYTLTLGIPQGAPGQNGTGSGNVNSTGTISDGAVVLYSGTTGNLIKAGGTLGTAAFQASSAFVSASMTVTAGFGLTGGGQLNGNITLALSWPVNAQTGTSYTVQTTDGFKLIKLSNAAAVAVSLQAAGTNFPNGWETSFLNLGAGTVTITPASGTINGAASLTLTTGQSADVYSDGTNYLAAAGSAAASGGGGSGFPSAFATKSANYTVLATDAGTQFTLTGSGTLTLPSAASMGAGKGIYVKKVDGNGAWTIAGTVDGLSSLQLYSEGSYAIVSNGTNYVTQGRPKGLVPIGSATITTAVTSLSFTTLDPEIQYVRVIGSGIVFSASDTVAIQIQKNGAYLTSGYTGQVASVSNTSRNDYIPATGYLQATPVGSTASTGFDATINGTNGTLPNYMQSVGYSSNGYIGQEAAVQSTSGVVQAIKIFAPNGSNLTSGVVVVMGYRA